MSDPWRPHQYAGTEISPTPATPQPRSHRGLVVASAVFVVVAALLAVAFSGLIAFGPDSDAFEVTERAFPAPVFEPAFEEGADPFYPLSGQLEDFEFLTGLLPSLEAINSGLFGETAEETCDPQRLIRHLLENPVEGQAWAMVQGIEFEDIPDYIGALEPRVLAAPITVLNHGFDAESGQPYEVLSTFDAGTAVLVDENGDIRARCYCGNPVKPLPAEHKPPRCLLMPTMAFNRPGGKFELTSAPHDVALTGRVTTDGEWTEISWGFTRTGWTPTSNLANHLCTQGQVDPIAVTPLPLPDLRPPAEPVDAVEQAPAPEPTPRPQPTPTPEPQSTPTPRPQPSPTPRPQSTPTPQPQAIPTPTATPVPPTPTSVPPTPTATPVPVAVARCTASNFTPNVGQAIQISSSGGPANASWFFDTGDGGSVISNPGSYTYLEPGEFQLWGQYVVPGASESVPVRCGFVIVQGDPIVTVSCGATKTTLVENEEFTTLIASHTPSSASVSYVWDHGDGFLDPQNPSDAKYQRPGTYHAFVEWTYLGETTRQFCIAIEVVPSDGHGGRGG